MVNKKYPEKANGFPLDPLIFAREPANDQFEEQAFAFPLDEILLYLLDRKKECANKEQITKLISSNRAFRERIRLIRQEIRNNEIRTVEEYKKYTKKEADTLATVFINSLNKTYEHLKEVEYNKEISGSGKAETISEEGKSPVKELKEKTISKRPYFIKKEKVS